MRNEKHVLSPLKTSSSYSIASSFSLSTSLSFSECLSNSVSCVLFSSGPEVKMNELIRTSGKENNPLAYRKETTKIFTSLIYPGVLCALDVVDLRAVV